MMTRATSTSTKPMVKVEMRSELVTPTGPRMSSMPVSDSWFLLLKKLNWKPFSSTPR